MKPSRSFPGQVKTAIFTNIVSYAVGLVTLFVTLTLVVQLSCSCAYSAQLTLAWDPIDLPEVTGYKIYYGPDSGYYTHSIDAGAGTFNGTEVTYTVADLPDGLYYFAATAYDSRGIESGYSNEVSAVLPYENQIIPPTVLLMHFSP